MNAVDPVVFVTAFLGALLLLGFPRQVVRFVLGGVFAVFLLGVIELVRQLHIIG